MASTRGERVVLQPRATQASQAEETGPRETAEFTQTFGIERLKTPEPVFDPQLVWSKHQLLSSELLEQLHQPTEQMRCRLQLRLISVRDNNSLGMFVRPVIIRHVGLRPSCLSGSRASHVTTAQTD